ncbi:MULTISPECIES: hypothetical protein [unclassified Endozoicomonas]|uniref:hypothetical protein n=1 Tax=unclassified Endozoicomonas TaxID=2644528 RepID=UPI003BB528A2
MSERTLPLSPGSHCSAGRNLALYLQTVFVKSSDGAQSEVLYVLSILHSSMDIPARLNELLDELQKAACGIGVLLSQVVDGAAMLGRSSRFKTPIS